MELNLSDYLADLDPPGILGELDLSWIPIIDIELPFLYLE